MKMQIEPARTGNPIQDYHRAVDWVRVHASRALYEARCRIDAATQRLSPPPMESKQSHGSE